MRKQTARIGLSFAVLPLSALAVNGLPSGHSTGSSPGAAAAASGRSTSAIRPHRHGLIELAASVSPETTVVAQVTSEIAAASSQVLDQGRVIAARNAGYQQALARSRAVQSSHLAAPATTAPPSPPPSVTSVSQSISAVLACIRQYESGDNYSDTSNPYYRGAYQFAWSTWESVGGAGDPAAASPSEQDMRASTLAERSGWGAWSTASMCGV